MRAWISATQLSRDKLVLTTQHSRGVASFHSVTFELELYFDDADVDADASFIGAKFNADTQTFVVQHSDTPRTLNSPSSKNPQISDLPYLAPPFSAKPPLTTLRHFARLDSVVTQSSMKQHSRGPQTLALPLLGGSLNSGAPFSKMNFAFSERRQ